MNDLHMYVYALFHDDNTSNTNKLVLFKTSSGTMPRYLELPVEMPRLGICYLVRRRVTYIDNDTDERIHIFWERKIAMGCTHAMDVPLFRGTTPVHYVESHVYIINMSAFYGSEHVTQTDEVDASVMVRLKLDVLKAMRQDV